MSHEDQVPWFATSNGVIDLRTSADFRDHRFTNNQIVPQDDNVKDDSDNVPNNTNNASSEKKQLSMKVVAGGLPPLVNMQRRPSPSAKTLSSVISSTGPPPPKDNELYGDILVIPPIKPKPLEDEYFLFTRQVSHVFKWSFLKVSM